MTDDENELRAWRDSEIRRVVAIAEGGRRREQEAHTIASALLVADRLLTASVGPCSVEGPPAVFGSPPGAWCKFRHGHEGDHVSSDGLRWRPRTVDEGAA